jgi:hypothetical protein
MSKISVINPEQSYSFSDYFKLNNEPEEIFAYFGYLWQLESLNLPRCEGELIGLDLFKSRLIESLPYVSLTSEIARREFLIAPVILELIHYTKAKVRVEYSLTINEQLKGSLDYYLTNSQSFLIIEGQNANLERGLVQLGVELIAVDIWSPTDYPYLYGAVSLGNIWQFMV